MDFINWCNNNQGFVTAIFSLLSLLISTIAVVISILTAKLPYKKALRISAGSYIKGSSELKEPRGVYVNALNIGNIPVKIDELGLLYKNKQYINVNTIAEARVVLKQMESVDQMFSGYYLKEEFRGKTGIVYAFAKDAEGRIYKKRICHANDFLYS